MINPLSNTYEHGLMRKWLIPKRPDDVPVLTSIDSGNYWLTTSQDVNSCYDRVAEDIQFKAGMLSVAERYPPLYLPKCSTQRSACRDMTLPLLHSDDKRESSAQVLDNEQDAPRRATDRIMQEINVMRARRMLGKACDYVDPAPPVIKFGSAALSNAALVAQQEKIKREHLSHPDRVAWLQPLNGLSSLLTHECMMVIQLEFGSWRVPIHTLVDYMRVCQSVLVERGAPTSCVGMYVLCQDIGPSQANAQANVPPNGTPLWGTNSGGYVVRGYFVKTRYFVETCYWLATLIRLKLSTAFPVLPHCDRHWNQIVSLAIYTSSGLQCMGVQTAQPCPRCHGLVNNNGDTKKPSANKKRKRHATTTATATGTATSQMERDFTSQFATTFKNNAGLDNGDGDDDEDEDTKNEKRTSTIKKSSSAHNNKRKKWETQLVEQLHHVCTDCNNFKFLYLDTRFRPCFKLNGKGEAVINDADDELLRLHFPTERHQPSYANHTNLDVTTVTLMADFLKLLSVRNLVGATSHTPFLIFKTTSIPEWPMSWRQSAMDLLTHVGILKPHVTPSSSSSSSSSAANMAVVATATTSTTATDAKKNMMAMQELQKKEHRELEQYRKLSECGMFDDVIKTTDLRAYEIRHLFVKSSEFKHRVHDVPMPHALHQRYEAERIIQHHTVTAYRQLSVQYVTVCERTGRILILVQGEGSNHCMTQHGNHHSRIYFVVRRLRQYHEKSQILLSQYCYDPICRAANKPGTFLIPLMADTVNFYCYFAPTEALKLSATQFPLSDEQTSVATWLSKQSVMGRPIPPRTKIMKPNEGNAYAEYMEERNKRRHMANSSNNNNNTVAAQQDQQHQQQQSLFSTQLLSQLVDEDRQTLDAQMRTGGGVDADPELRHLYTNEKHHTKKGSLTSGSGSGISIVWQKMPIRDESYVYACNSLKDLYEAFYHTLPTTNVPSVLRVYRGVQVTVRRKQCVVPRSGFRLPSSFVSLST